MERHGDWMITYTGKRFWPLDPRADEVCFADIGAALSMTCRYGGHTRRFYSVAEHSTLLARYFLERGEGGRARYALAHDMPEAYVGDIIRPLKKRVWGVEAVEGLVADVVAQALGQPWNELDVVAVEEADTRILVNEARAFWTADQLEAAGWSFQTSPLPHVTPVGVPPADAERDFRHLFELLFPGVAYE